MIIGQILPLRNGHGNLSTGIGVGHGVVRQIEDRLPQLVPVGKDGVVSQGAAVQTENQILLPGLGPKKLMNYPARRSSLPDGWGFRRAIGSKLFTKLYPRGITFFLLRKAAKF